MGRQYCGICMCPYDDDGSCGCENPNETNCNGFCGEYECKENKENCLRTKAATNKECNPMGMNKPVAWMGTIHGVKTYFKSVDGIDFEGMIPLYTQDKLEEARQQGMRQERALWNLAKSTQEIEANQSQDIDLKETSFQTALNKEMKGKEPVAVRYDFDGYGYQYMDSGSGSDWKTRIKDAELLYTQDCVNQLQAENKELHAIAQRMAMAESDARKSLQNIKDHPAELTDEEIMKLWKGNVESCGWNAVLDFAKAILRKASEK